MLVNLTCASFFLLKFAEFIIRQSHCGQIIQCGFKVDSLRALFKLYLRYGERFQRWKFQFWHSSSQIGPHNFGGVHQTFVQFWIVSAASWKIISCKCNKQRNYYCDSRFP